MFIWGCVPEDRATAEQMAIGALSKIYAQDFSRLVGRSAFAGAPDQVVERSGAFAEAGARTIVVSFACPAEHVSTSQQLFADEVLPALRS